MPKKKLIHSSTYYRLVKKLKSESDNNAQPEARPEVNKTLNHEDNNVEQAREHLTLAGPSNTGKNADDVDQAEVCSAERLTPEAIPEPELLSDQRERTEDDFITVFEEYKLTEAAERHVTLRDRLRQWANERRIPHIAVDDLLGILRQHGHEQLPKDSRTLLQTPAKITIERMGVGQFWYNGVRKNLERSLKEIPICPEKISLIVNIDGIAPFDSSPKQFWPILFLIHEIRQIQPMVAAVYYGDSKPPLGLFFEKFVLDLNDLCEEGLEVNDKHITISIRCFVCDTPARSYIKATPGFNAEYGSCIKCTVVGEFDRRGRHMSYPRVDSALRTDESFRNKSDEDHHKEDTPLTALPINMIEDFVVADSLHLIDLGITRKCLFGWREGSYNFRTKFSKQQADSLSQLLEETNKSKPLEINRAIRSLKHLKFWKGSEYRVFLLYLGPVFLKEFLEKEAYEHLLYLSCAITILSCHHYLKYIAIADDLLKDYIEKFIEIYGIDSISSNVHNLSHMIHDVKKFGLLPSISAYPFEDKLGQLTALVRTGNLPLSQIAKRSEEMSFISKSTHDEVNVCLKYKTSDNYHINMYNGTYNEIHITDNYIIRSDEKNNYFLTKENEVVCFINGTHLEKQIYLYGQSIQNLDNLFETPFPSKQLNIFKTKIDPTTNDLSKCMPRLYPLEKLKAKLFRIKYHNECIFFPLIHTLDVTF